MPNSLDSYRDVYEWPYAWSQDIDPRVVLHLQVIKGFFPLIEWWTYENHQFWHLPQPEPRRQWLTDIYWEHPAFDRGQVPPDAGDSIADLLVELFGPEISALIWNFHIWRRETGWLPWQGKGGDFVDHLHVEWDASKFEEE